MRGKPEVIQCCLVYFMTSDLFVWFLSVLLGGRISTQYSLLILIISININTFINFENVSWSRRWSGLRMVWRHLPIRHCSNAMKSWESKAHHLNVVVVEPCNGEIWTSFNEKVSLRLKNLTWGLVWKDELSEVLKSFFLQLPTIVNIFIHITLHINQIVFLQCPAPWLKSIPVCVLYWIESLKTECVQIAVQPNKIGISGRRIAVISLAILIFEL